RFGASFALTAPAAPAYTPGPCGPVHGRRAGDAVLRGAVRVLLRDRVRPVLVHAVAPGPGVAAAGRELLLLRELEQVAPADHLRVVRARLLPRPVDRGAPVARP